MEQVEPGGANGVEEARHDGLADGIGPGDVGDGPPPAGELLVGAGIPGVHDDEGRVAAREGQGFLPPSAEVLFGDRQLEIGVEMLVVVRGDLDDIGVHIRFRSLVGVRQGQPAGHEDRRARQKRAPRKPAPRCCYSAGQVYRISVARSPK